MTIGSLDIQQGDVIGLLLAAASAEQASDPEVYDNPDTFDPQRRSRNLAFGLGTHFCLGAPLARLEARIALTRFAERIESPRLDADPAAYRDSISLRGPERLEILFG